MSIIIDSIFVWPGGKLIYYCKDGLNSLDVYNVETIFNFGGQIVGINCGAETEYGILQQVYMDMWDKSYESPAG